VSGLIVVTLLVPPHAGSLPKGDEENAQNSIINVHCWRSSDFPFGL